MMSNISSPNKPDQKPSSSSDAGLKRSHHFMIITIVIAVIGILVTIMVVVIVLPKYYLSIDPVVKMAIEEQTKTSSRAVKTKVAERITILTIAEPIEAFDDISHCIGLKHLELKNQNIIDYTPLNDLDKLEKFIFEDCGITSEDAKIFETTDFNGNLKHLSLAKNQLSNIDFITALSKLETLNLNDNNISDITPISKLGNLQKLYISNNKITSLDALKELSSSLHYLDVTGNPIQDWSPVRNIAHIDGLPPLKMSSKELNLKVGETVSLSAETTPTSLRIDWTISNDNATVSGITNAKVTGLKGGIALITATRKDEFATCWVTVTETIPVPASPAQVSPAPSLSIKLSTQKIKVKTSSNATLTATVSPKELSKNIQWKTGNSSIATVSSNASSATITGHKAGQTTITATIGIKSVKCTVSVYADSPPPAPVPPPTIPTITIADNDHILDPGDTCKLTFNPSLSSSKWTHTNNNTECATFDKNNGKITAKKHGTANFIFYYDNTEVKRFTITVN